MKNCVIQRIEFLAPDFDEHQLYVIIHGCGSIKTKDNSLLIGPSSVADFGTYFNSLSIEKWIKYTTVTDYHLSITIRGQGIIQLYHAYLEGGRTVIKDLKQVEFNAGGFEDITLDIPAFDIGLIGFRIASGNQSVELKDAFYFTNQSVISPDISLALAFTTYKRETYIKENIRRILSLSDDRVHICIADNAGTLDIEPNDSLSIYKNTNSGGAGGFARNMIEIIRSKKHFTHVILMDDDVLINPMVFERLMAFLSMVKETYSGAFVGGAMLRSDQKCFHVESGAKWLGTTVSGFGHGLDMRRLDHVLQVNSIHEVDYNAWWFCCIPVKYIREDNLPLPLFFQWDDVDYGIRNKAPVILLNGICLWHDPFESKRSAMYTYYSTRNPMIVNGCRDNGISKKQVIKWLKKKIKSEVSLYRYEHARAIIRAMEDFCKGPEWLCSLDADGYNKEILKLNKPITYVADQVDYKWYQVCCQIGDCDLLHKIIRKMTFNGYLLTADREVTLPFYAELPAQGYRAKNILFYDIASGNGFRAERSGKEALVCMRDFYIQYFRLKRIYGKSVNEYRDKYRFMSSVEMWEKYLRISNKHSKKD